MMKKVLLLSLVVLLLSSCATYTIKEARSNISEIKESEKKETRYRVIQEQKNKNEVLSYPSDLSALTYPFFFNENKDTQYVYDDDKSIEIKTIFIPLGEKELDEDTVAIAAKLLSSYNFDIIALSGSLTNQTKVATEVGKSAITIEGGTIIFSNLVSSSMDKDYISLNITENKLVDVIIIDYHPTLPPSLTNEEAIELMKSEEDRLIESLINKTEQLQNENKLFFLSSVAPSSFDWTDWTDYEYRKEEDFLISDTLNTLKWNDAFYLTHFSVETESGVTRRIGEYEERLDFIYSKNLIPISSFTVPIEKLENIATVATFVLP